MTLEDIIRLAAAPDLHGLQVKDFKFGEGRRLGIHYRGGWNFELLDEPGAGDYVVDMESIRVADMTAFEPPLDLVVRFAGLPRVTRERQEQRPKAHQSARQIVKDTYPTVERLQPIDDKPPQSDLVVEPVAMRTFLEKFGPIDIASDHYGYLFAQPASELAEALSRAQEGDLGGAFRLSLRLYAHADPESLLATMALQALAQFFHGNSPVLCPGCDRFFFRKRRDARYCSDVCRNKINKRASRKRQRRQEEK